MHELDTGAVYARPFTSDDVERCACPLCGAEEPLHLTTERGAVGVVRCRSCGAVYSSPRPRQPEKNYQDADPDIFLRVSRLIVEGRAPHHRDPNYKDDLRLIARFGPSGRLLDIGTLMGMFLRKARGRGWELYGVEPSPGASEFARRYFGLDVRTGYLREVAFPAEFFDVVTMTDVLEHVTDPYALLCEVRRVLKVGGILFVKVPNVRWSELKLALVRRFGRVTSHDVFDAYEHVVHYSDDTLRRTLARAGFRVLFLDTAPPVQPPVWYERLGEYFQYPSPWYLDWKRHLGRRLFYSLGRAQWGLTGRIGPFAPNIRVVAARP